MRVHADFADIRFGADNLQAISVVIKVVIEHRNDNRPVFIGLRLVILGDRRCVDFFDDDQVLGLRLDLHRHQ